MCCDFQSPIFVLMCRWTLTHSLTRSFTWLHCTAEYENNTLSFLLLFDFWICMCCAINKFDLIWSCVFWTTWPFKHLSFRIFYTYLNTKHHWQTFRAFRPSSSFSSHFHISPFSVFCSLLTALLELTNDIIDTPTFFVIFLEKYVQFGSFPQAIRLLHIRT